MSIVVPDIRQQGEHECGDVVIEVVRRSWGRTKPLPPRSNSIIGLPPESLALAFREDGFVVVTGEMDIDDLRHFTKRDRPVAAVVSLHGGHWVAVLGVWRHFVEFHCPKDGRRRLRIPDWQRVWADSNLNGFRYCQWGVCPWLTSS